MKKGTRNFVVSLLSFLVVAFYYPGFDFGDNFGTLAIAACIFASLTLFVRPLLKLLMLPFNLLTFGVFSFVTNVIIIYAVGYLVTNFKIVSFHFSSVSFQGFSIPAYDLNVLTSALVASFLIGWIAAILHWIFH